MSELMNEARRRAARQMEERKQSEKEHDHLQLQSVEEKKQRTKKRVEAFTRLLNGDLKEIISDARKAGLKVNVNLQGVDEWWHGIVDNYYQYEDIVLIITISMAEEVQVLGSDFFSDIERSIRRFKKPRMQDKQLMEMMIYGKDSDGEISFFTDHEYHREFSADLFREKIIDILAQLESEKQPKN